MLLRHRYLWLWAAALSAPSLGHAAIVTYSADPFNNATDVSTNGSLLYAYNLGNTTTSVAVNGVTFAADNGTILFASNSNNIPTLFNWAAHPIAGMTQADAQALFHRVESAPVGVTLAQLSNLIVGHDYEFQILIADDRTGSSSPNIYGGDVDFGYATPSGVGPQIYPLLDVPIRSMGPFVITGTFTADEIIQDLHVRGATNLNGRASAFQLRDVTVPEPSSALLWSIFGLGTACVLARRFARRGRAGRN